MCATCIWLHRLFSDHAFDAVVTVAAYPDRWLLPMIL